MQRITITPGVPHTAAYRYPAMVHRVYIAHLTVSSSGNIINAVQCVLPFRKGGTLRITRNNNNTTDNSVLGNKRPRFV